MDLKHRHPIPIYCTDRSLLMSRAAQGVKIHDDPCSLERLQAAEFVLPDGELTAKGQVAVEEIKRLAVERVTPSPRFPVDF